MEVPLRRHRGGVTTCYPRRLTAIRAHATIGAVFVTQNAYPREALLETVLRFVEEDLSNSNETG